MTGDYLSSHVDYPGMRSVVVLTIATEQELNQLVTDAVAARHWQVTYSTHRDYVSETRRPSLMQGTQPDKYYIAFIDFDQSIAHASEAANYLSHAFGKHITVVAVSATQKPELMLAAMRAGCGEFLSTPSQGNIGELLDRLETRWLGTGTSASPVLGSVLSMYGAKGGVGTTTLAVHLAMFLTQCHGRRTLLVDARPELGHACVYLGMDGSRCQFEEVVRNFNRLDSELLNDFVGRHPSGLHVLSSPDVSGSGVPLPADAVERTLSFLRMEYDFVVVDSGPPLDAFGFALLEASSQIYLVTTPEIGAVRDLSRYIDRMMPQDTFAEKLKIVLNRSGSQHAIPVAQIEKAVRLPIALRMPDCYSDLMRSENLGEPIAPTAKSELAQAMVGWVDGVVGVSSRFKATSAKNGMLSMWKQVVPHRVPTERSVSRA